MIVDGGVRRATDIVVALALDAAAVGIGPPVAWALACRGDAMAEAFLADLVDELRRTFTLLGVVSLSEFDRSTVSRVDEFASDGMLASMR